MSAILRLHPRRLALLACCVAVAGFPLGCASDRDDRPADTLLNVDDLQNDPFYKLGYSLQWRGYPGLGPLADPLYFDVEGELATFQDTDNTLSLIETDTGRVRWSVSLGDSLEKFVGNAFASGRAVRTGDLADGRVVIAAGETELQIFDAETGNLIDRQRLSDLANTQPIVNEPSIILGSTTGQVFAHDLPVGVKVWGVDLRGAIDNQMVLMDNRSLGVVSNAGDVIMLDIERGTSNGRRERLFEGVATSPVTDGDTLYVASLDQSIYAFGVRDARRQWRVRTESPLRSQPALHEGLLMLHIPREGFVALDARTGQRVWTTDDVEGEVVATRPQEVLVWNENTGEMILLDLSDGDELQRLAIPNIDRFKQHEGVLYAIERNGVVSKYAALR